MKELWPLEENKYFMVKHCLSEIAMVWLNSPQVSPHQGQRERAQGMINALHVVDDVRALGIFSITCSI